MLIELDVVVITLYSRNDRKAHKHFSSCINKNGQIRPDLYGKLMKNTSIN